MRITTTRSTTTTTKSTTITKTTTTSNTEIICTVIPNAITGSYGMVLGASPGPKGTNEAEFYYSLYGYGSYEITFYLFNGNTIGGGPLVGQNSGIISNGMASWNYNINPKLPTDYELHAVVYSFGMNGGGYIDAPTLYFDVTCS